nr:molybdopterin-guanine dinucleotide biosynthesis protein B [uncultured Anaeromusa sp.]
MAASKIPIVSFVSACSGAGKTTLLEKVVVILKQRGLRLAVIKHDAHRFEMDHPGKDTWRLAQAGADVVVISSPEKVALLEKVTGEKSLDEVAAMISGVDLILTEGFKQGGKLKIEVYRAAMQTPLCSSAEELLAIAGDTSLPGVPCYALDDAAGVASELLRYLETVKLTKSMIKKTGALQVGLVLFSQVEELDFIGPFETLSYANKIRPNSIQMHLVAERNEPVWAFNGLRLLPDCTLAQCPDLDIVIAPGGKGRLAAMKNPVIQEFLRRQAVQARYMTSVCTGAFLLAEAGLLQGKRATTYHTAMEELAAYGVKTEVSKVVQDGKVITAGGVSSGLELGLYLLRLCFGLELAREVARKIEYEAGLDFLANLPQKQV